MQYSYIIATTISNQQSNYLDSPIYLRDPNCFQHYLHFHDLKDSVFNGVNYTHSPRFPRAQTQTRKPRNSPSQLTLNFSWTISKDDRVPIASLQAIGPDFTEPFERSRNLLAPPLVKALSCSSCQRQPQYTTQTSSHLSTTISNQQFSHMDSPIYLWDLSSVQ